MKLNEFFSDKSIKTKDRPTLISEWLLMDKKHIDELVQFVALSKDPIKATCIEAIEHATKENAALISKEAFDLVIKSLESTAPRVKWESARVIGNVIHLFPSKIESALNPLLKNTEHTGTVVRWSAAFAIGEILKLKTKTNIDLIPAIESIIEREEKNSIKKIYLSALKIAKK